MDYVSHLAERPCLKQAGLQGCGKGEGQESVNSEESRARKERIKLYSCRAEECPLRDESTRIWGKTRQEAKKSLLLKKYRPQLSAFSADRSDVGEKGGASSYFQ